MKLKRKKLRTRKALDNKKIVLIVVLVLFISIGFSVLTTNLVIQGVATIKACPAGTYSTLLSNECKSCPTGYTSDKNSFAQSSCYIKTTAGKYISTANSSTQTTCEAGYKCPSSTINYGKTGSKTQCSAGTYAPAGSSTCSSCPSGYTSDAGATAESECYVQTTAGKYIATAKSSTQTSCSAGYFCLSMKIYYGSTGGRTDCPAGYYCPAGVRVPSRCPEGYTSEAYGTAITSCYVSVSGGSYKTSATGGSTASCSSGTYREAHKSYYNSSDSCTTCPAGYYCPAGGFSSPLKCPDGETSSAGATICKPTTYTYQKKSNGWTGTYTCSNGTATLTSCSRGGTVCDGGSERVSATYGCTLSFQASGYSTLQKYCQKDMYNPTKIGGGGLPETESCS